MSLDGVTRETYESIRRNASFERVLENLRYFRDYTRHLVALVAARFQPDTPDTPDTPASVASGATVLRDIPDLLDALAAARLFHLGFGPVEDRATFLDRRDRVGTALASAGKAQVQSALQNADVRAVYAFLSAAPEAEFERTLRFFTTAV